MPAPYYQVSRDAALALTEFSDEMRSALSIVMVELWAAQHGMLRITDALKTVFPIPLDAAGYKKFEGDVKYRSLYSRSLQMKSEKWQDGVKEEADVVEAPDFSDWAGQPATMAFEWQRQPNLIVADLLAEDSLNGPLLDFYANSDTNAPSTRRMFATDHPFNVLEVGQGTWSNIMTTTVSEIENGNFFGAVNARFRSINGPNGKPMGLRMGGGNILAPATREEIFKEALEQDTLVRVIENQAGSDNVAAVTKRNLWKSIGYTIADEFLDQDHFYCIAAAGPPGLVPWVIQQGSTLEEIVNDKNSAFYKTSLEVSLAFIGKLNAQAALPHRIIRVEITG